MTGCDGCCKNKIIELIDSRIIELVFFEDQYGDDNTCCILELNELKKKI